MLSYMPKGFCIYISVKDCEMGRLFYIIQVRSLQEGSASGGYPQAVVALVVVNIMG